MFLKSNQRQPLKKTRFNLGPRFVQTPLKISVILNLIILLLVLAVQPFIQPVVPLFHSFPTGSAQLVNKGLLLLFPTLSFLINIIHIGAIKIFTMNELIVKLYAWADLVLQLILLMISLRNILVVFSI